jgi:hypothetical protein
MKLKKYQNIINHYTRWRKENPDTWIDYTVEQPDILSAIKVAAKSDNKNGKRNNHQRRLKKESIENFIDNLSKKSKELFQAKDFTSLLGIIESCKVKGIGELTCYDTANRIGCKIGVYPDKIYLHAGTKIGAEKLFGKRIKKRFIDKSELPEPFKSSVLDCAELEDILCIYKSRF